VSGQPHGVMSSRAMSRAGGTDSTRTRAIYPHQVFGVAAVAVLGDLKHEPMRRRLRRLRLLSSRGGMGISAG